MNKKEQLIWSIIDNVISCCAITRADGTRSITREDLVSKSREENVVMARALVVEQMVHAGFTITSIACILNRTVQATRHLFNKRLLAVLLLMLFLVCLIILSELWELLV